MRDPPKGTVTFLFTDIEGSTRLWEERPDEMRAALAEHDAHVRAAIHGHGGYVFSTGGDGFAAAFSRAADAIDAAAKAQAALADHRLLRVRMGIHTGEVQERDGDYFGPAVNRAARIMAAGHGGQVLVSAVTRGLLSAGVELNDLGEHRLRDFQHNEHLFQLGNAAFPPLRISHDESRSNIPSPRSTFFGRETDIDALCVLVGDWRVVTIIGPGGVGKTRTAARVGQLMTERFRDGVWWVELGSVTAADAVDAAVAASLRVQPRAELSLAESLADQLRRQSALIVLDNCEHVLDAAAALVDAIISSCADVVLIATSREPLGLDGEHVYPLGPLVLPDSDDVESVARASATALFVDRARAVDPGFGLDATNAADVAWLCRRLDAMPLAIELAAAKTMTFAPAQIELMLHERFRLLTRSSRDGPRRQQTLEATIAWSYDLLTVSEATLLDRLSVFVGSFDLAAAQAVAGGEPLDEFGVAEALNSLVRKSLVVSRPGRIERRFALLETVRAFAERRLVEANDWDRCRGRHLDYRVDVAEQAGRGFVSPEELVWTARVIDELDDFRHAFRWALQQQRVDDALRIAAAIGRPGYMNPSTGIHAWCEDALGLDGALAHPLGPEAAQWVAGAYANFGDFDKARHWAEYATQRELETGVAVPFAWIPLAGVASVSGRRGEATSGGHAMIGSAMRSGRPDAAHAVAIAAALMVNYDATTALETARAAIAMARDNPTPSNHFNAYMSLAYALLDVDPGAALRAADESMEGLSDTTLYPQLLWSMLPRIAANIRLGRDDVARSELLTALRVADRSGQRWGLLQLLALAPPLLARSGARRSAEAIDAALDLLGGEAARPPLYGDLVLLPPRDLSLADLPAPALLRTYDELVQFAIEALTAVEIEAS